MNKFKAKIAIFSYLVAIRSTPWLLSSSIYAFRILIVSLTLNKHKFVILKSSKGNEDLRRIGLYLYYWNTAVSTLT